VLPTKHCRKGDTTVPLTIGVLFVLALGSIVALGWLAGDTRRQYQAEVVHYLSLDHADSDIVQDSDLAPLPPVVQRYLRRAGVVGQPRAHSMSARWSGRMRRAPGSPWFPIQAEQHNIYGPLMRTFFIRGRMMGIPILGRDLYAEGRGQMVMRVLGLVPVVDLSGDELAVSGLVTIFNDMCLLSPSALLDRRVGWHESDERSARASLTDGDRRDTAKLQFDDAGDLADFTTDDRFMEVGGGLQRVPWSTPVSEFREIDGRRRPTFGQGVWRLADGEFVYAEFRLLQYLPNPSGPAKGAA
jgi:hypothetical protein